MSLQFSVIIPAYNAEAWLDSTTQKIATAMSVAKITDFEIIIVNDGSSDNTKSIAENINNKDKTHYKVISHPNSGRYLTRKKGVQAAKYDRILFIDTRVWIDERAIQFLKEQLNDHADRRIWNGHINVAKKGNIIARFGDALTLIGWRRYFKKPQLTSYGLRDFDYYPKGTGLFSAPKQVLLSAMEWFESTTSDIKNSSDDTLLIRRIAEQDKVWLSPEFSGTYFARTSLGAFMKHTYYRGQYFVDGFLRKGTRFYYPLLAFLILSAPLLIITVLYPVIMLALLLLWTLEFIAGLYLGLKVKDSVALFVLTPLFVVLYGAGIWRAVIRRMIHEKR